MAHFAAESIHFSYAPGRALLNGFSISGEKGERIALTGPSGSGKSTLGLILTGHLRPESGRVWIDGQDRTSQPSRDAIIVHQEPDLFPWLKPREQLYAAMGRRDPRRAGELLDLFRLSGHEELWPYQLSGGMQKRLSIARALALNPRLIVFDEAFSSLDGPLKLQLIGELAPILAGAGTCSILISHDPREIEIFAARTVNLLKDRAQAGIKNR